MKTAEYNIHRKIRDHLERVKKNRTLKNLQILDK